MALNANEQKVLDLICRHPGGMDINDLIDESGLSYKEIEYSAYALVSKGYRVTATSIGEINSSRFSGWIKRLLLSPYDKDYKKLISGE
jgi:hypothetical protein